MLHLHNTYVCVSDVINIHLFAHTLNSREDLKAVPSKVLLQLWHLMSILQPAVNVSQRQEHSRPGNQLLLA